MDYDFETFDYDFDKIFNSLNSLKDEDKKMDYINDLVQDIINLNDEDRKKYLNDLIESISKIDNDNFKCLDWLLYLIEFTNTFNEFTENFKITLIKSIKTKMGEIDKTFCFDLPKIIDYSNTFNSISERITYLNDIKNKAYNEYSKAKEDVFSQSSIYIPDKYFLYEIERLLFKGGSYPMKYDFDENLKSLNSNFEKVEYIELKLNEIDGFLIENDYAFANELQEGEYEILKANKNELEKKKLILQKELEYVENKEINKSHFDENNVDNYSYNIEKITDFINTLGSNFEKVEYIEYLIKCIDRLLIENDYAFANELQEGEYEILKASANELEKKKALLSNKLQFYESRISKEKPQKATKNGNLDSILEDEDFEKMLINFKEKYNLVYYEGHSKDEWKKTKIKWKGSIIGLIYFLQTFAENKNINYDNYRKFIPKYFISNEGEININTLKTEKYNLKNKLKNEKGEYFNDNEEMEKSDIDKCFSKLENSLPKSNLP